ncbi:8283_t:CDS:2, partial [Entrophospora sp. SA101]
KRQGSVLVIYSVTNSLLSLSFVLAGIFLPTKFKIEDATKSEYTWCGISGILFSISSVANYGMALALSVELYVSLRVTNPAARKEPLIQRLNFVLAYILPLLSIILSIIVLLAYDDNVFETIDAGGICEVSRHGKNLLALFFLRTLTEYLAIFPSCVLSVLSLIPVAKVVFKNRKLQFSMTGPCSISKESTKPNTTITTRAGPPPNSSTSANHKYLLPRNVLIRMGLWCSLLILLGIPTSVIVLYRNIKNLTDPTNTDLSFYLSPGQTDFLAIYGFTLHMVLSNGLFLLCFGTGKFANEQYRILWTTILQKIFFCCRPKSRIPSSQIEFDMIDHTARHSIISLPEVAAAYGANTTSSGSIIINTIARTMTVNSNSSSLRIKGGGGDLCVSDNSQCEKVDNTNDDGDGTENRTTRIVIIVIVLIVLFFVGLGLCIYLSVTRIKKRDNDKRTNVVNNRDFDNDKKKLNHSILEKDRLKKSLEQKKTNILRSSDKLQNLINSIEKDCEELKGLKNAEESNDKESIIIKENIEEEKILIEHLNAECFENEKTRRHLHNVVQNLKGNIRVFCRVRPQTSAEKDVPLTDIEYPEKCESKKIVIGSAVKNYLNKKKNILKEYEFDHVFKPDSTQGQVYTEVAADIIQSVVDGYNCCIFAYGQTGAGKTYTMQGSDDTPESEGMITRAFKHIFDLVNELEFQGWSYTIEGQFIEIYNDRIYDLLISHGEVKDVKITHNIGEGSTRITNVKTVNLESPDYVNQVLRSATKNRIVASTKMNDNSSRSHSIFMIHIKGSNSVTNEKRLGSLNLIDLAGSEKISAYESTGDLQVETININKSLSSLKTVIQNIKENASHINYRDSTLTYVLKNSLVNISPVRSSQVDTENSLEFGRIAKAAHISIAKKG